MTFSWKKNEKQIEYHQIHEADFKFDNQKF